MIDINTLCNDTSNCDEYQEMTCDGCDASCESCDNGDADCSICNSSCESAESDDCGTGDSNCNDTCVYCNNCDNGDASCTISDSACTGCDSGCDSADTGCGSGEDSDYCGNCDNSNQGCETGCEVSCQEGCEVSCQDCQSTCEINCQTSCQTSCQEGCEVSCQEGCEVNCQTSCQTSCQEGCEVSCQDCQTGCQVSCQIGCEISCDTGCEVSCEETCESSCESACEGDCQTVCQTSCQSLNTCDNKNSCFGGQTCNTCDNSDAPIVPDTFTIAFDYINRKDGSILADRTTRTAEEGSFVIPEPASRVLTKNEKDYVLLDSTNAIIEGLGVYSVGDTIQLTSSIATDGVIVIKYQYRSTQSIKTGWLTTHDGTRFAPKTAVSQMEGVLPIEKGGTGTTDAATALKNLGGVTAKEIDDKMVSLKLVRSASGAYRGEGTTDQTINIGFRPLIVIINDRFVSPIGEDVIYNGVSIKDDGFEVSGNAYNEWSKNYTYIAIG
jgi:hypothetical protein